MKKKVQLANIFLVTFLAAPTQAGVILTCHGKLEVYTAGVLIASHTLGGTLTFDKDAKEGCALVKINGRHAENFCHPLITYEHKYVMAVPKQPYRWNGAKVVSSDIVVNRYSGRGTRTVKSYRSETLKLNSKFRCSQSDSFDSNQQF